jgi:hypothetical protein
MPRKKGETLGTAADKAGDVFAKAVSAPLDVTAATLDGVAEAMANMVTGMKGEARISEGGAPK